MECANSHTNNTVKLWHTNNQLPQEYKRSYRKELYP